MANLEELLNKRNALKNKLLLRLARIKVLKQELEVLKSRIYLDTEFKSKPSDKKGRDAEFIIGLSENKEYQSKFSDIAELDYEAQELDNLISGMNFAQRELLIKASKDFKESMEQYAKYITTQKL